MDMISRIEETVISIDGISVIIDSEVANIYGVETKRINEAVKNNPEKFPEGYIVQLTESKWLELKSKFSTSIKGGKTKIPNAFTEKGLYMLATILKSDKATAATIGIIETFAKIRELGRGIQKLESAVSADQRNALARKSKNLVTDIFRDDLNLNETETSIEINFAVIKVKHTRKRGKKM